MKEKKIKNAIIIAFASLITLMAFTVSSYGATKGFSKTIKVLFRDIKIYVNGNKLSSSVEPFIIPEQGVTMVPIRLVSEALGQPVEWDEDTSSIYIGYVQKSDETNSKKAEQLKPIAIENATVLRNVGPFYEFRSRNFMIAKRPFAGGIAVELKDEKSAGEVVLELKGQYSYLEGYIGVDDETRNSSTGFILSIYGDDVERSVESLIKPSDYPRLLQLDIRGVKRLTIKVEGELAGIGEYSKTIAALANFKLYK